MADRIQNQYLTPYEKLPAGIRATKPFRFTLPDHLAAQLEAMSKTERDALMQLALKNSEERTPRQELTPLSTFLVADIMSRAAFPELSAFGYNAWRKQPPAGVYVIECVATQKCYVGQSRAMPGRIYNHFRQLRLGEHPSRSMQFDYMQHGPESFRAHYVQIGPESVKGRSVAEQRWVCALQTHKPETGYNGSRSAGAGQFIIVPK